MKPYDFAKDGVLLGWGLRNSQGLAEHPVTGGIFSTENSYVVLDRSGKDISVDNPGEEMNFHGYLNGSTESSGACGPRASFLKSVTSKSANSLVLIRSPIDLVEPMRNAEGITLLPSKYSKPSLRL
ncbi:hypothetical protein LB505_002535 [Fusarium chuoi]|nr:hypothetical protein LB505_002535 [Fusarium chuoi]